MFYLNNENLLNNIPENTTMGIKQLRSIKNPNIRFPSRAPLRPNVIDNAAAITLKNKQIHIFNLFFIQRKSNL